MEFHHQRIARSCGSLVDNALNYQSRGSEIEPPLLWSFGGVFKTEVSYDLVAGWDVKPEFTH